ncbi:MAG: serine/threonine protein kinase [Planctomycetaceae bacterium]
MLEPPSTALLKTLSSLRLCSPRDLRRCRGYVRRLTHDLPAFDSIWIDALVQSQRLTAFQGHCLEASQGERLQVGPCLLLERLGGTATAETFLARRRDAAEVCVLKLTVAAPEQLRPQGERLTKLIAAAAGFQHPAIVLPQATQIVEWPAPGDWRQVTISRHVRGPHLAELLVRRGRFPIAMVVEIGRQLLDGLAALESRGLVHGDVSLSNVRITPRGQAVLVDGGLIPELRPQFTFHAIRSADRYDGLAPERISAGLPPSNVSDLYGLGCLLWHLLAGRPPFTAGDALAKIAAHQTQPINDVREWVPDTPDWLAELLLRWTAINPAARSRAPLGRDSLEPSATGGSTGGLFKGLPRRSDPRVADGSSSSHALREAASDLGRPTRAGRRRLAVFRGEFDRSTPRRSSEESSSRWPLTVAAIFMLTGAALSMLDQGARSFVLSLAQPRATLPSDFTNREAHREPQIVEPQPLPAPDESGRIVLAPGGRYLAEEVAGGDSLQLIGGATDPAEIVVTEQALSLWAKRIQLSHVRFVRRASDVDRLPPLLIADCQQLEIDHSRFEQGDGEVCGTRRPGAALAWRPQEGSRSQETRVSLQDLVLIGTGPAIYLQSPPRQLTAENVLKVGGGDFIQVSDSVNLSSRERQGALTNQDSGPLPNGRGSNHPGRTDWRCDLRRVTLRDCGPLLRNWPASENSPLSRLTLTATGCVVDLARVAQSSTSETARPALIAWMSGRLPPNWLSAIDWQLTGMLVPPDIDVIVRVDPTNGRRTPVDESRLDIDGLIADAFEFAGPASSRPRDSLLKSHSAPLPAGMQVGIDAEELPE